MFCVYEYTSLVYGAAFPVPPGGFFPESDGAKDVILVANVI